VGDGRLRAEFYPKCGPVVWSTAEVRKPAGNVVEFDLLIRDLIKGGGVDPGQPLRYRVYSEDFGGGHDWAPGRPNAFVEQAALPHLSDAELLGRAGSEGPGVVPEFSRSSGSEAGAANAAKTRTGGRFSPFGGLPIASVLLGTLIIFSIGWLVWRTLARRLFGSRNVHEAPEASSLGPPFDGIADQSGDDANPVHTRDT
jgi:hypothetical protein